MNKTVSITNDGDSPRYVMGRMIPPGETVVFAEDEAPPEYLAPAEDAAPGGVHQLSQAIGIGWELVPGADMQPFPEPLR